LHASAQLFAEQHSTSINLMQAGIAAVLSDTSQTVDPLYCVKLLVERIAEA
jgi:hypothetical protein